MSVISPLAGLHLLFLSVLLVLLPGCLEQPLERETEVTLAEALAFEPIGRGQRAALDTLRATEVAIRSAEDWVVYQDSLRPLQPFESVDFGQEMVLLAAVPVPSGGYSIAFETVEKESDSLLVHYILSTPAYDCLTASSPTITFQAVRVARVDTPIRFEQEQEAYRCTEDRNVF